MQPITAEALAALSLDEACPRCGRAIDALGVERPPHGDVYTFHHHKRTSAGGFVEESGTCVFRVYGR